MLYTLYTRHMKFANGSLFQFLNESSNIFYFQVNGPFNGSISTLPMSANLRAIATRPVVLMTFLFIWSEFNVSLIQALLLAYSKIGSHQ